MVFAWSGDSTILRLQAILAHFTKQTKRKTSTASSETSEADDEPTDDDGIDLDNAIEADEDDQNTIVSVAQQIHDTSVAKTIRERATFQMSQRGVYVSNEEYKEAEGIIPKVSYSKLMNNRR